MKNYFIFFLPLLAFISCSDDRIDNNQGGDKPIQNELTTNPTSISFGSNENSQTIKVYSTASWTAEFTNDQKKEWCSISTINGGVGDSLVVISVNENTTGEDRYAHIVFKSGLLSKTVTVYQKQKKEFSVTPLEFNLKSEGGEIEIEVKANEGYRYRLIYDWISLKSEKISAPETYNLVFEVQPNVGGRRLRTSIIEFASGSSYIDVDLIQSSPSAIYYTSIDEKVVEPYISNGSTCFGSPIASNTYTDGIGEIDFDGVNINIKYDAFYGCDNLATITIPDVVTKMAGGAFRNCPNLKEFKGKFAADNGRCLIVNRSIVAYADGSGIEYTIPYSVIGIEDSAFSYCNSLTNVTIPDSVIKIGNWAFEGCKSLANVTIGNGVTEIGGYAFYNCYRYNSIIIPSSVTKIGWHAFDGSSSLQEVYCKSVTVPIADKDGFNHYKWRAFGEDFRGKIYVPMESVDAYKTADGWKEYAQYIVGYDF